MTEQRLLKIKGHQLAQLLVAEGTTIDVMADHSRVGVERGRYVSPPAYPVLAKGNGGLIDRQVLG